MIVKFMNARVVFIWVLGIQGSNWAVLRFSNTAFCLSLKAFATFTYVKPRRRGEEVTEVCWGGTKNFVVLQPRRSIRRVAITCDLCNMLQRRAMSPSHVHI